MNLLAEAARLDREAWSDNCFIANFDSKSGGLVKIKRPEKAAADPEFYMAAEGLAATLGGGEKLLCLNVNGEIVVVSVIVTS